MAFGEDPRLLDAFELVAAIGQDFGQRVDPALYLGIVLNGSGQAMTASVVSRTQFAPRSPWAGAAEGVAFVGFLLALGGHGTELASRPIQSD
jgi:hypothetical protein